MKRMNQLLCTTIIAFTCGGSSAALAADYDDVNITVEEVGKGVHMLVGAGGNIGMSSGPDGVFLIDDQFAPLTEKIRAAVRGISGAQIRFVLNTHWHWDHTGGNENLAKAGTILIAHDNVRERLTSEQFIEAFSRKVAPSPSAALPVVTFSASVDLHLNGDTVHIEHVPNAHTDGDSIVYFEGANVLHMGDVLFAGRYPFIDGSTGGSVQGVLDAVTRGLELSDENTAVIPGHGPLTDRDGLIRYHEMLATVSERIKGLMLEDQSLEAIQAAGPTREFDTELGGGFISAEKFVAILYQLLKQVRESGS